MNDNHSLPASLEHADVAVLGAGVGGSITAALLAEHGYDVCLLEAGGAYSQADAIPFSRAELEAAYARGGMTVSMGACPINYAVGQCLGGGSEINSGLYHRPPREVLARWGEADAAANDDNLIKLCEDNERNLHVVAPPAIHPASMRLANGAKKLQWQTTLAPRWHRYPDVADSKKPDGLALGGRRQSMSETFLPRFVRAGGRVLPHCAALSLERVQQQGDARWKIHARCPTHHFILMAKDVFVACGAVQTPILLRRSGIKSYRGQAGDGLQMHVFARVLAEFPDVVNAAHAGIGGHQIEQFAPAMRMGCAISSPEHLAVAIAQTAAHDWQQTHNNRWQQRAAYYVAINGGRGSVRSLLGDELVRYQLSKDDYYTLADGVRYLSQALFAAGASKVLPIIANAPTLHSESELWKLPRPLLPRHARLSSVHLMSSAPLGKIADAFGRVYEHNGLHIADTSLFYDSPNTNPQGTLMAFARRNALAFANNAY